MRRHATADETGVAHQPTGVLTDQFLGGLRFDRKDHLWLRALSRIAAQPAPLDAGTVDEDAPLDPRSGYALGKEIETRTGWKPSWGSIYPQLESLQESGMVSVSKEGRARQYALTVDGKKWAKKRLEETSGLLQGIIERMRTMQALTGEDLTMPIAFHSASWTRRSRSRGSHSAWARRMSSWCTKYSSVLAIRSTAPIRNGE